MKILLYTKDSRIISEYYDFHGGNAQLQAKRSRGFHPRRCGSPNAITPEQVLRHHPSKHRGGMGGQALSILHRTSTLYFTSEEKELYRAQFFIKNPSGFSFIHVYMPRDGNICTFVDNIHLNSVTRMKCPIREINTDLLSGAPCCPGAPGTSHPLDTGM